MVNPPFQTQVRVLLGLLAPPAYTVVPTSDMFPQTFSQPPLVELDKDELFASGTNDEADRTIVQDPSPHQPKSAITKAAHLPFDSELQPPSRNDVSEPPVLPSIPSPAQELIPTTLDQVEASQPTKSASDSFSKQEARLPSSADLDTKADSKVAISPDSTVARVTIPGNTPRPEQPLPAASLLDRQPTADNPPTSTAASPPTPVLPLATQQPTPESPERQKYIQQRAEEIQAELIARFAPEVPTTLPLAPERPPQPGPESETAVTAQQEKFRAEIEALEQTVSTLKQQLANSSPPLPPIILAGTARQPDAYWERRYQSRLLLRRLR